MNFLPIIIICTLFQKRHNDKIYEMHDGSDSLRKLLRLRWVDLMVKVREERTFLRVLMCLLDQKGSVG